MEGGLLKPPPPPPPGSYSVNLEYSCHNTTNFKLGAAVVTVND